MRAAEIAVSLFLIVVAGAMLAAGRNLAPNPFEPIGSGAIPNGVAWITLGLALALLVCRPSVAPPTLPETGEAGAAHEEPWLSLVCVAGLTIAYVLGLSSGLVRYQWLTLAFLPAVILVLSADRRRAWPWALGVGAVFAFGLDYVFRHILVADIP